MSEVIPEKESVSLVEGEATPAIHETNESFLGSVLVLVLVILLVGAAVFFAFFGYRIWRDSQIVRNTPSIQKIVTDAPAIPAPTTSPVIVEEAKPETTTPSVTPIDKTTLDVKVMNGGAAKGSAGTFGETLKKAGYTKTTVGNTTSDYTGVAIYYAAGKQKEAESLQGDVAKTYPQVTLLETKTGNADTAGATLVVILGK